MTFKVCNLGSKQPYFNSAYVVRVPIFSFTTVLNIDFGQGAAKISEVKVGGQKKYLLNGQARTRAPWVSRVGRYFFQHPTLTSDIFAAS